MNATQTLRRSWRNSPGSLTSLVALFGGIPMVLLASPRGWDGLPWILYGVPACVAVSLFFALAGWVAREPAAPWIALSVVALVMAFLLSLR